MLKLFNTLSKKSEVFKPVNRDVVNLFTCGPSVYQRSHIGNFKTFMFEDILVRYLEYLGYRVSRGMNFTDVEDKAIEEAGKRGVGLRALTTGNIRAFMKEMKLLKMKIPDYLPRASETVGEAVEAIRKLLDLKIAYWHNGSVYFDPLKYTRFGKLYGLDMKRWPSGRRRFHKDTYPGMRWNLGDFILWHGGKKAGKTYWDTEIGRGRPSWNIQDAGMILKHVNETLSVYCGGIDNLLRHHDYTLAILESICPYPMSKFWLHCQHLKVGGKKMSKSRGNIVYSETVLGEGYPVDELRFFLLYGHYRKKLNYSAETIKSAAKKLRRFKKKVAEIATRGDQTKTDTKAENAVREIFATKMNDDLHVEDAFDALDQFFSKIDVKDLTPVVTSGYIRALKEIDQVLGVIF
ncbi:MAG: class I tRNA ligase family protein [Desulfobacterales bacterium]|nr:class I tRNA ligase family protein [Desulfobacterales bacterium]